MLRAALLPLLVLLPAASAFHADGPIVGLVEGQGDGWVAFRVEGAFTLDFVLDAPGTHVQDGVAVWTGEEWRGAASRGTSTCGLEGDAIVRVGPFDEALRIPRSCTGGWSGWGWGAPDGALGVAWATGDVGAWRLEIRGADARLASWTSGAALDVDAEGFAPAAVARVDAGGAGARASTGGTIGVEVPDVAFGWFGGADTELATVASPEGERACPCVLFGEPAGSYAFTLQGAGVTDGHAALSLAPVALPLE